MQQAIIHLDMDAFFASVEQVDDPRLVGQPVIVGGSPERGVVCACSYEARAYGVHSAMAMAKALKLCPAALVRPVRKERYRQVSRQIFTIFSEFTDRVEPLSIDEAFLDVTGCERLLGAPLEIARTIIARVKQETGLTVSAGVAANKFLAKLASSRCKPAGLLELKPEQVDAYLLPLPIEALWGVGPKTAGQLHQHGVRTVADLRKLARSTLENRLGQLGGTLYELCRGMDEREVISASEPQSIGAEETFAVDLLAEADLNRELLQLATQVTRRVRRSGRSGRTLQLKIKYADFSQVSRSATFDRGEDSTETVYQTAKRLLHIHRHPQRPIRLLGLYLSDFQVADTGQQELFGKEPGRNRSLDAALDSLQERFGAAGATRATLIRGGASTNGRKQPR
ncbi:MAG TPA: DNA polymerase IV [Geothermobacteraceae bacterium]|nr:DNA polymerase IV [Geothermobacteraceae bacterium]